MRTSNGAWVLWLLVSVAGANEPAPAETKTPRVGIGAVIQIQREQAERRLINRLETVLCKDAPITDANRELCAKDKDPAMKGRYELKDPPPLQGLSSTDKPGAEGSLNLLPPEPPPPGTDRGKIPEVRLPGPPGYPRYRLVAVLGFAGEQRAEVLVNRNKRVMLEVTDRLYRYEVVRIFEDGVEMRHLDRPGDVRFYPIGALLR